MHLTTAHPLHASKQIGLPLSARDTCTLLALTAMRILILTRAVSQTPSHPANAAKVRLSYFLYVSAGSGELERRCHFRIYRARPD